MTDFIFMGLGARRSLFTELYCTKYIPRAIELGYEPRVGEVERSRATAMLYGYTAGDCDRIAQLLEAEFPTFAEEVRRIRDVKGIPASVHLTACAADTVLALKGSVTWDIKPYVELGKYWETLHPLCRAGYRFGDSGHVSVTPDGVRK